MYPLSFSSICKMAIRVLPFLARHDEGKYWGVGWGSVYAPENIWFLSEEFSSCLGKIGLDLCENLIFVPII